MGQPFRTHQVSVHLLFRFHGDFLIFLVLSQSVQLPHHASPESIGPPVYLVIPRPVVMDAVNGRIWNLVGGASAHLLKLLFCPLQSFAGPCHLLFL